jgi:hypothetical protein
MWTLILVVLTITGNEHVRYQYGTAMQTIPGFSSEAACRAAAAKASTDLGIYSRIDSSCVKIE